MPLDTVADLSTLYVATFSKVELDKFSKTTGVVVINSLCISKGLEDWTKDGEMCVVCVCVCVRRRGENKKGELGKEGRKKDKRGNGVRKRYSKRRKKKDSRTHEHDRASG